MTVKELKKMLNGIPDDVEVLTFSSTSFSPVYLQQVYLGKYKIRERQIDGGGEIVESGKTVTKYERADGPDDERAVLLGREIGRYLVVWPK